MRGIMADNDIQGQMTVIVNLLLSDAWHDIWKSLNLVRRRSWFKQFCPICSGPGSGALRHHRYR